MIATSENGMGKAALIVETPRGPSFAGTRLTIYDLMDYLKAEWRRDDITQIMSITDEQLDAALTYIAAHGVKVERDYAEILRYMEELRVHYDKIYWERSRFTPDTPPEERRRVLLQVLEERKKAAQASNGNHSLAGQQP